MLLKHWGNSTGWEGDYLGGRSPLNLEERWGPVPFDPYIEQHAPQSLEPTENSAEMMLSQWSQAVIQMFEGQIDPSMAKRIEGFSILARMPDQGIDDAIQSLREIADFYEEQSQLPKISRETRTAKGRIVSKEMAPNLVLPD